MNKVQFYFEEQLDNRLILDTWRLAYRKDASIDLNYIKWRAFDNPIQNKPYLAYIIVDDELASFYTISPVEVEFDGGQHRAGLMNMATTHPEHQGKGYYVDIELKLHELIKSEGFLFAYGFANHQAHRLHRKHAGWKDLAVLNQFRLRKSAVRSLTSAKPDAKYSFESGRINSEVIELTTSLSYSSAKVKFKRSKEYLVWRLLDNPSNRYFFLKIFNKGQLSAVVVYKMYLSGIDILEVFYAQETYNFEDFGSGIYFLLDKAESVDIWSNLQSDEHLYLEKIGFVEEAFSTYFGVIPFVKQDALLQLQNWHYRFIDSDVF